MKSRASIVVAGMAILYLSACNDQNKQTQSQPTQTPIPQPQEDQLSVSITLDSLPDSITYNRSTTPDGYIEYQWGVVFDINGDGAINQGDIELQILHFKSPGSIERIGKISDLGAALWVYTTDTQRTSTVAAKSDVSGNTITLSISKTAYPSLKSITGSTLVYFETTTYDTIPPQAKYDYHPSFSTLLSIPSGGNFTDPQGDIQAPYIDMLNMKISL